MDIVGSITRWFKQLFMGRVHQARASAKGKIYGQQARLKGKVAGTFNKGVDSALKAPKKKLQGAAKGIKNKGGGAKAAPKAAAEDKKMGWFGKKDKGPAPQQAHAEGQVVEDHTLAVDVSNMEFPAALECVGWVVVRNGPLKGKDFRLVAGKNTIGSAADCEVVLTDPYLSSKHATIRFEDGDFTLVDLDSTNGTHVNETRVVKTTLVDNDTIRIGRTTMKFKALE